MNLTDLTLTSRGVYSRHGLMRRISAARIQWNPRVGTNPSQARRMNDRAGRKSPSTSIRSGLRTFLLGRRSPVARYAARNLSSSATRIFLSALF